MLERRMPFHLSASSSGASDWARGLMARCVRRCEPSFGRTYLRRSESHSLREKTCEWRRRRWEGTASAPSLTKDESGFSTHPLPRQQLGRDFLAYPPALDDAAHPALALLEHLFAAAALAGRAGLQHIQPGEDERAERRAVSVPSRFPLVDGLRQLG
jgi:hypothetical protein